MRQNSNRLVSEMSVRKRVEDAEFLWKSGRREGAWVLAMVATAATARKRYPKPMSDNQSFKNYIRDVTFTIASGRPKLANMRDGQFLIKFENRAFEDVLYEDYRCYLIHEGGLKTSGLTESSVKDGDIVETLVVGQNIQLPDHWVLNLLNAIRWSPENAAEFAC